MSKSGRRNTPSGSVTAEEPGNVEKGVDLHRSRTIIGCAAERKYRTSGEKRPDAVEGLALLRDEARHPEVELPRYRVIFSEGEPADRLYVIQSGMVKLGHKTLDGKENLLSIMGPSEIFGELSILDPGPRTSTATAITDVRAIVIDRPAVQHLLRTRPEIAEQLLQLTARRLRRTNAMLTDLVFTDVPGRVAKALLELAERFGDLESGLVWVPHELTQVEIAQYVGGSRETVNKALNDFAQRGWLRLADKSVLILNIECLARRARWGVAASGRVGAGGTRAVPPGTTPSTHVNTMSS